MTFILGSSPSGRLSYDWFGPNWGLDIRGTLSAKDGYLGQLWVPGQLQLGGGSVGDIPVDLLVDLEVA